MAWSPGGASWRLRAPLSSQGVPDSLGGPPRWPHFLSGDTELRELTSRSYPDFLRVRRGAAQRLLSHILFVKQVSDQHGRAL